MDHKEHLFVYGTLRRGVDRAMSRLLIQYAKFTGLGTFQGRLYDLGTYPGIVPSVDTADAVVGEIYVLHDPDRILNWLDKYEDYTPDQPEQSLYLRRTVSITMSGNKSLQAWIYLYNRPIDGFRRIESGDYLQYLNGYE